ncbi:hypothetical protein IMCC3317_32310 [Kordia antarctica]|uniref:LysM domain-containing protein n=1 Tax=Kordia antarctica TaxID=1218801 RepID=A0A7L4ZMA2_9FLAO|nr:LysM domain-containing protein [Kordia antarctica]QHI37848.1 hypothetical protein IMCC3317_32310 [Kordia antarctica]
MEKLEKTFMQIAQPYIKTILFAIIGTLIFTITIDYKIENREEINEKLTKDYQKKRDSLLSIVNNQGKKLSEKKDLISDLLEKSKKDSIAIDSLKNSGINIEIIVNNSEKHKEGINNLVSTASNYLTNKVYIRDEHKIIIKELNKLYDIKGLSDPQNKGLLERIREMNSLQIINFKKNAGSMNQDNIVTEADQLLKLTWLTKTQKKMLHKIKNTLKKKIHFVKEKETLYSISKKYNISADKLIEMNPDKIDGDGNIKAGDTLKISN